MLNFKEGQTYICTNAEFGWWTEGKEYKVFNHKEYNKLVLIDDQGTKWLDDELSDSPNKFKLKEEPQMLGVKEGQTYVCKSNNIDGWTLGEEYRVEKFSNGVLYIRDNEGLKWYLPNDFMMNMVFKLKEKTFDLNALTIEQLKEYVALLENKENAERSLTDFIERMSKECLK